MTVSISIQYAFVRSSMISWRFSAFSSERMPCELDRTVMRVRLQGQVQAVTGPIPRGGSSEAQQCGDPAVRAQLGAVAQREHVRRLQDCRRDSVLEHVWSCEIVGVQERLDAPLGQRRLDCLDAGDGTLAMGESRMEALEQPVDAAALGRVEQRPSRRERGLGAGVLDVDVEAAERALAQVGV